MQTRMPCSLLRLLSFCFFLLISLPAGAEQIEVKIGVLESKDPKFYIDTFGPTMFALRKMNPNIVFKTAQLSLTELQEAIKKKQLDFFIAPSAFFAFAEQTVGAKQIAARNEKFAEAPNTSVGSVFITHLDRQDLADVRDLKGVKVASTTSESLENWISAMGEIKRQGFPPRNFFGSIIFTNHEFPDVITLVLNKSVDVGILGACELEKFFEGNSQTNPRLKVIGARRSSGLRCLHSSDLYPDMIFASIPSTPSKLVHKMTLDLLSIKEPGLTNLWSVANNFNSIKQLYTALDLPPFEEKKPTLSKFWERYKAVAFAVIGLFLLLLMYVARAKLLVAKRTQELNESIRAKQEIERKAHRAMQHLAQYEKMSIVSQMSSMIAHEIHQPLHSLLNYSGGLVLYCKKNYLEDAVLTKILKEIDKETQKISGIVEHVRSYAKNQKTRAIKISSYALVKSAVETFSHTTLGSQVDVWITHLDSCELRCEPLEIELLLINLLKNAAQAVERWPVKKLK